MTPEAADYLDKARDSLDEARKIGVIGLARVAARAAYYAAFHTAEAFIVERTGKIAKSIRGFARNLRDWRERCQKSTGRIRYFWQKDYKHKELADYGVGHGAVVTTAEADDAIENAARFIDCMTTLLAQGRPQDTE